VTAAAPPPAGRLDRLLDRLRTFYGLLPPPPHDPFTLFVWEVLSVHSTPRKRDAALAGLKRARVLTPDAMWRAPQKVLEASVRLAGPYLEQRLIALKTGVDLFRRARDLPSAIRGPLPSARRALKGLPRLGEAGAYRMLLFAADHPVLPVDARVSRVARRLGYGIEDKSFTKTARSVREAVSRELAPTADAYRRAFVYLEHHGASTCAETDPHCGICPLLGDCSFGIARGRAGLNESR
jgi:endonuclease III